MTCWRSRELIHDGRRQSSIVGARANLDGSPPVASVAVIHKADLPLLCWSSYWRRRRRKPASTMGATSLK